MLVVSSVLPDAVPISVLLAMKVKCDNVLAIKQKWAEQGKIMEQCLVKVGAARSHHCVMFGLSGVSNS